MKFPNLAWAARQDGLTNYRVAASVQISETAFSRCLGGRRDFSLEDLKKIADFLCYPEDWLFSEVAPPARCNGNRNHNDRELVEDA